MADIFLLLYNVEPWHDKKQSEKKSTVYWKTWHNIMWKSLMDIALEIRMMYCRKTHSRQHWLSAWSLGLHVTADSNCTVVMRTLWPETMQNIPWQQTGNSDTILSISPVRTVDHQNTLGWQYVKRMTSLWVWLELLAWCDQTDMNSLLDTYSWKTAPKTLNK